MSTSFLLSKIDQTMYTDTEISELKSRKQLTDMLTEQIDSNENLSHENSNLI